MTIEARRIPRGVGAILLALALIFIAAVPTAMADTIYPDNVLTGSSFDNGLVNQGGSGWTEVSNNCTVLLGLLPSTNPQVCQTHTSHAAGIGTPPGSLQQSYNGTADGLAPLLFEATAVGKSSPFTIGPNQGGSGATTFQFDRRADVASILNIEGQATFRFVLVNETAGNTEQELWFEELDDSDNTFLGRLNNGLPNVIPGNTYHIRITTVFNCAILCVGLQETVANFDNIRLRVADGTPTFNGTPTAITDPASDITGISATLNGRTNANGLPSQYRFRWGVDDADDTLDQDTGLFSAGTGTTLQPRSRGITGLTPCTTYLFRIEAVTGANTAVGNTLSFRTDCAPSASTDPALPSSITAQLNSTINPNGSDTTYHYEWGLDSLPAGQFPNSTPNVALPGGNTAVAPNAQVISGLQPLTTYRFRVIAQNLIGTTDGGTRTFTTIGLGLTGPQGPQGEQGVNGDTGASGANGTNGVNGVNGAPGAQGVPGVPGTPGATGPVGPRGPAGQTPNLGSSIQDLLSTNALAMIRIDATRIRVPMRGRDVGRVRVQIFCRPIAVRTCSGNMKVRTVNKINPASTGTRPARRVTWATDAVQLDVRKIGFAILNFNAQRRAVLRRFPNGVRSSAIVSVIDANNNRQNVRRTVTVVAGR